MIEIHANLKGDLRLYFEWGDLSPFITLKTLGVAEHTSRILQDSNQAKILTQDMYVDMRTQPGQDTEVLMSVKP